MSIPTADPVEASSPRFGALLWTTGTDWPALRDAAVAVDRAGFESMWVSDHLMASVGPWTAPIYEAWTVTAALAVLTERASVGQIVSSITFRNPALVAKLAATVDHLSGGRSVLGLGGGWFEREHLAHGIDFGASAGERLDRLDEAVPVIRSLLDGETVTHHGSSYAMDGARHSPRPLQRHLRILIGGEGKRKTLRTVARYADMWHGQGSVETLLELDSVLADHCARVGRDPGSIERMTNRWVVIRDDVPTAQSALRASLESYGVAEYDPWKAVTGPPELVAEKLRPLIEAGFGHVVISLRAPFDHETISRVGEVRELLVS